MTTEHAAGNLAFRSPRILVAEAHDRLVDTTKIAIGRDQIAWKDKRKGPRHAR